MTKEPLSNAEKELHRSNANLLLLEELEMDQALITIPLIFAVIAASASQFLVGYNTGVMNAPESVVFPGHSTASWSIAVAAFAVGGPFGANLAGTLADSRGRHRHVPQISQRPILFRTRLCTCLFSRAANA